MATYVLVKLNRLPTRVFVVLPNSGHVTNEGALAEFVYQDFNIRLVDVNNEKNNGFLLRRLAG